MRQQAAGCLLQDSLRPCGMRVGVEQEKPKVDKCWRQRNTGPAGQRLQTGHGTIAGDCEGPNLGQGRQGVTMVVPKAGQD
jgi:hypothetical protein